MTSNRSIKQIRKSVVKKLRRVTFTRYKQLRLHMPGANKRGSKKNTVFVSGVQRSGTNMLMAVLERSFETDVFNESDPRAFDNYILRDREVIHDLVAASLSNRVVVKALQEGQKLAWLLDEFAPAQAIWLFRNYDDVVNSHLVLWPGWRNMIERLVEDRNAAEWRGENMTDETHAIVKRIFRPNMNDATAAAIFWYYRNQFLFDQGFEDDDCVFLLKYEEVARDSQAHLARLGRFLDIDITPAMSAIPRADSVHKQPPADIDPDVRALCDSMWARLNAVPASNQTT